MKVVRPTPIVTAMLTASSVAEADHPEWSAGTTYAKGARVVRGSSHRRYESVAAGNLNHDPVTSPANWLDIGPTNRWAMFDQSVGSATTGTGSVQVTFQPGAVSAVAVIDTDAELVTVSMAVGATEIYRQVKSTNISGGLINNWFAYFFDEIGRVSALTFLDVPVQATAAITVRLDGADPAGPVAVGTVIAGRTIDLGLTEAGPGVGITDFSRKDTDIYGVTDVVERPWTKRMTARSMVPTRAVDGIQRSLASLRAVPALWIGEQGYDSLTIYGFYKDFSIDVAYANNSFCSLTIEGLI